MNPNDKPQLRIVEVLGNENFWFIAPLLRNNGTGEKGLWGVSKGELSYKYKETRTKFVLQEVPKHP